MLFLILLLKQKKGSKDMQISDLEKSYTIWSHFKI